MSASAGQHFVLLAPLCTDHTLRLTFKGAPASAANPDPGFSDCYVFDFFSKVSVLMSLKFLVYDFCTNYDDLFGAMLNLRVAKLVSEKDFSVEFGVKS